LYFCLRLNTLFFAGSAWLCCQSKQTKISSRLCCEFACSLLHQNFLILSILQDCCFYLNHILKFPIYRNFTNLFFSLFILKAEICRQSFVSRNWGLKEIAIRPSLTVRSSVMGLHDMDSPETFAISLTNQNLQI